MTAPFARSIPQSAASGKPLAPRAAPRYAERVMTVPLPVIVVALVAILALVLLLLRRRRDPRGDLLAPPPSARVAPPPVRANPPHPAGRASTPIVMLDAIRSNLPEPLLAEVGALLREERLIEAIKRVREETGLGLREAKDTVELMRGAR